MVLLRETGISDGTARDQSLQKLRGNQRKWGLGTGMTITLFLPCHFVLTTLVRMLKVSRDMKGGGDGNPIWVGEHRWLIPTILLYLGTHCLVRGVHGGGHPLMPIVLPSPGQCLWTSELVTGALRLQGDTTDAESCFPGKASYFMCSNPLFINGRQ